MPRALAPVLAAALLVTATATLPPYKPPAGSTNATAAALKRVAASLASKSRVLPPGPQVDVPFNYDYYNKYLTSDCSPANNGDPASLGFPGACPPTLPWSDPRVALATDCSPDQVALKWWGTDAGGPAVVVSWATCPPAYVMTAASPADTSVAPSVVRVGKVAGVYDQVFTGVPYSYTMDYTNQNLLDPADQNNAALNGGVYVSPVLHHTRVGGLVPGLTYHYKIEGPPGTTPFAGSFKVPGGFPTRVGVVSDPGQTTNTSVTFDFLKLKEPNLLLMAGDLTYADNNGDWNMFYDWTQAAQISDHVNTFSPRWDAWGRLVSPLASKVPLLTTAGNHEIEATPEDAEYPRAPLYDNMRYKTRFANYLARFPAPQTVDQALNGPSAADLAPITPGSDQGRGLYYTTVVPGTATIVVLSSYTFAPSSWTPDDPMLAWLDSTLAAVDRKKTPWVVVMTHVSWYSTSLAHAYEAECMRAQFEPLFRKYGVDIFIAGHDHAYERSAPVYNYKVDDECGTVYLVTGYNGDEVNYGWMDQWPLFTANPGLLYYSGQPLPNFGTRKVATCAVPTLAPSQGGYTYSPPFYALQYPGMWGDNGRCVTSKVEASGTWCPDSMPDYSVWREDVYGAGVLDLVSPTEAVWSFYSQGTAMVKPADTVVIKRNPLCALKAAVADDTLASLKNGTSSLGSLKNGTSATLKSLVASKLAGLANGTGKIDVEAAAEGVARQAAATVAAKINVANFTVATWANTLRNKTGGLV